MVTFLHEIAEREKIIVVAPDSNAAPDGTYTWQVADRQSDPITDDLTHAQRCVQEVLALPDVEIDRTHVLVMGHSGGGSFAPYLASHDELYTAFASLHGGAFPGGLGKHRVRGWFSTGTEDQIRPVDGVIKAADGTRSVGFAQVEVRTYRGGHHIAQGELEDLIAWWLGR
jgi:predicted esterase